MRKFLLPWRKAFILFAFLSGILPGISKAFQATGNGDTLSQNPVEIPRRYLPVNVPVLFGEQSRIRLVQSVGYLDGKRLESSPVTSLSNAFAGHLAGLNSIQSNGAPRYDIPGLQLRGKSPLIIIDGIPRYNEVYNELSLNPEQIESVTLLKDGLSTVMLGNRAMNGVLMITTRKKSVTTGSNVSLTVQRGVQTPIGMRKALSSFDYASLYNEARVNSGLAPVYSQEQLTAYRNGTDPFLYPNVDWNKTVLRDNAPQSRYTLNASGNYTNVRYFLSLDYQNQKGLFREDAANSYGTNLDYTRYIFRSNIEINVNKSLTANLYLIGNIQDYIQPGVGYQSIFTSLGSTPSNATPVRTFMGSFAGTRQYSKNPFAEAVGTGYLKNNLQGLGVNVGLTQKTDKIIKGSFVKAVLSYSPSYEQQINRSKNYNAYYYPVTGDTSNVLRVNAISEQPNSSTIEARSQQTYVEVSTGVERHWNKNDLNALILASHNSNQFNNDLSEIYQNVAARFSYGFDKRFNVELAGAYSSNNRFAPGKKAGFYPGAGASWNVDQEDFLKDNAFFDELKLRVSYAKVGHADPGYYAWQQTYAGGSAYMFGTGATSTGSIAQGAIANPDRVTEKAKKANIGVDLAFSKQRGWLSIDYFNSSEYDLLQLRGDSSALFGNTYPLENIGKNRYSGIELNAGWAATAGKLRYSISGNLSTVASKVIFNDEPQQEFSNLQRTGLPVSQIRGYVSEGFYGTGNLNAASIEGFTPSEGDVRYRDLNGDGVVNALDQTIIGNDKPLLYFGADLHLQYAGFDLTVLFQGIQNRDILTSGNYQFPFSDNGRGQAYDYHLNRYTPGTAATATLPRVTIQNEVNNYLTSSLYVRNGGFIRLKNLELGYSLPAKILAAARIKGLRLFVNAQNLATFSKYKDSDPENYTGLYPLQRVLNGGLSVKF
ncbi:SusC/RagA family TonB-linked outer membrane protein [Dyadobacter sp. CY323]|uniref:SusC/RagA family TonB-linked outer membrane protein n=1 Tax=Dyadobacter sp. CY323 TaxID=2907302 RepID=UPI001F15BF44|nr:SusC/RagA family TonB-linked outer membrane protein [Dyadobacter sp. CY323]MCE6991413.1 SusC/RagA family TonB-linked outer membrane protein [Dyadobacter sp. CY323]